MHESWYKNAVVYSLDVETFYDYNGDGIGDFHGLSCKLDYLASLGITCLWLLPFYPSPNRDNGYDVMDYYNVDPRLGSLGDFAAFMHKADALGIRVLIDLVVNHTSIEHPWFQEARKDKNSPYRNYYVWADEPKAFEEESLMFTGEEDTVWTYDQMAKQYYLHRFYKEQPDLNIANPDVRREILEIMGFWLRLGVSGFRVDATEILIEPYALDEKEAGDLELVLEEMRTFLNYHKSDAILLAETNLLPKNLGTYLQKGRMQTLFNFFVNQYLFLSLATEDPKPLTAALKKMPELRPEQQWLNFLRHHDELSLKLLGNKDRDKVYARFAPDEDMRIFKKGIRRRLAPMLDWNKSRLQMAYSLLFSIPGIPLLRYGDEIAMGDDLSLHGRDSVRTVMQWTNTENGGFSPAPKRELARPIIDDAQNGFAAVNVLESLKRPQSLLHWIKGLIASRKLCPEIGYGRFQVLDTGRKHVLAYCYQYEEGEVLLLHNFSGMETTVDVATLNAEPSSLVDILRSGSLHDGGDTISLEGYGCRWLKVLPRS